MSAKALHTAARRYLLGRQGARELLRAVERRGPEDFRSAEEARRWLLAIAARADDAGRVPASTMGTGEGIRIIGWREVTPEELGRARAERAAFAAYVRALDEAALRGVAPLPYRRVLREAESRRWRAKLAERWDAHPRERYWYPLRPDPPPPDVLALQHLRFLLEVEPEPFRALFHRRGIARVFEFVENPVFEDDYVIDPESLVPDGAEVFWTSRELDWVLYVSHEHSITVAGDWLVAGVKAIWPNWRERVYTDFRYTAQIGQDPFATSPWFLRPPSVSPEPGDATG